MPATLPPTPPRRHFPSPFETPTTAPTMAGYVTTDDGAELATFVYGDLAWEPTPVLMLHGNGEEHAIFGPTIDAIVATGRPVVALDARGQGKSTLGSAALSYELLADDALVATSCLGVRRFHVLGFSDGGIEALLLARDHPGQVASLTVLGANLTPEGVIEDPDWDLAATIAAHRAWAAYWACPPQPKGVNMALLSPTPEEAARTAELLQLMLDEPHIEAASLSAICCPTTLMVGEFDCITEDETQAIHQAIAGSRLVVVPEAGHSLPKQVPDTVTTELMATIARAEA